MPGGQHAPEIINPEEIDLRNSIIAYQNHPFSTSGRGKLPGKPSTYAIRGAEMFVSSRSKAITRSTILYAYRKVRAMDKISGPKAIGVDGDSYIYAVFKALGVI